VYSERELRKTSERLYARVEQQCTRERVQLGMMGFQEVRKDVYDQPVVNTVRGTGYLNQPIESCLNSVFKTSSA